MAYSIKKRMDEEEGIESNTSVSVDIFLMNDFLHLQFFIKLDDSNFIDWKNAKSKCMNVASL